MSEALRLAHELILAMRDTDAEHWDTLEEAAAELRQLHAENERLRQINQSHEMKLSVRGYEIQIDDIKALTAELVEALRCADAMLSGANMDAKAVERKVSAALAKMEASK